MFTIVRKKFISKKVIRLFVLLPILIFVVLRIGQGFGYMESYFKQVFQIISYKRMESYEERQFQTMGLIYLYPKKMADSTSENSTICFWERNPVLNAGLDVYFLYPRIVKTIDVSNSVSPTDQIKDLKCNYLVMNSNFPSFDIRVKGVIIFGQGLEDVPVVLKPDMYKHNNPIYQDKTGLLEL